AVNALVNRAPSLARRSRLGVTTSRFPYAPTDQAAWSSVRIEMTFHGSAAAESKVARAATSGSAAATSCQPPSEKAAQVPVASRVRIRSIGTRSLVDEA